MTTLHQPREAGFTDPAAYPAGAGTVRSRSGHSPLRLLVLGEALAGDVALVAGGRARLTVAARGLRPIHHPISLVSALAALLHADLVLVADGADGPVVRIAAWMKARRRIVRLGQPEGAHQAARMAYFTAIADALIGIDRDGVFLYADRAGLAAAGHAPETR